MSTRNGDRGPWFPGAGATPAPAPSAGQPVRKMPRPHWSTFARGRMKKRGELNELEQQYADYLNERKAAGAVLWWAYERITFQLTDSHPDRPPIKYTPDFAVLFHDGRFELHELKGFPNLEEINRAKVCADQYPIRLLLVSKRAKKRGGGWILEEL